MAFLVNRVQEVPLRSPLNTLEPGRDPEQQPTNRFAPSESRKLKMAPGWLVSSEKSRWTMRYIACSGGRLSKALPQALIPGAAPPCSPSVGSYGEGG